MNKSNVDANITRDSITKLEECLRGEYSAVETYDLAIKHVKNAEAGNTLRQIRDSHDRRVTVIRERLRTAGAEPARTSTVWGGFSRIVQSGGDFLADRTAMAALQEGEDRCVKMYVQGVDRCDPVTRRFLETDLRQEQEKGHGLCRSLERFFRGV